jgi:competence protein ComFC
MPGNLAYYTYRLLWEALDWLYPPTCGGCNRQGVRWCVECAQITQQLQTSLCPICGNKTIDGKACERCKENRPYFECLKSYTEYQGPIRKAVQRLKYKHDMAMGEALSRLMISRIEELNWPLNLVTSVPLGLVRFKERGYNQANLLARPIALWLKLPFTTKALRRKRETRSQVGLTAIERQENMLDAFKGNEKLVVGKNILLVDDVATSGATLNASSKALLDAGAIKVYSFTLARATYNPDMEIIDL